MSTDVPRVHVVDDDREIRLLLGAWLKSAGYEVEAFSGGAEYLAYRGPEPRLICLDLHMPKLDGITVLQKLRERGVSSNVVVFTADGAVETAVECMKLGAFDFQVKPILRARFLRVVEAAMRPPAAAPDKPTVEAATPLEGPTMLGSSGALSMVREEIRKVSDTDITVFIHGESGTGKELVARSIHASSPRARGPFVPLNCGAIPESLQESVLFGHEKGAFTGANESRKGKFEAAHGGTLLLDEIAELSASAQIRLLRVLQERHVERVGAAESIPVDVRVVSATHRDLRAMVATGEFRQDLYYRLVIYPIEVPALRERPGDVRELFTHYVDKHAREIATEPPTIDDDVWPALRSYAWPGNVRELANVAHRCVVAHRGGTLRAAGLGLEGAVAATPAPASNVAAPAAAPASTAPRGPTMADAERKALEEALAACNGNVTAAAKRLGIGRATLYRKLSRYGLSR
ncbi:MAG: sigma-54 dependent transcriptional regulator [Myxococcota bacterium]